MHRIDELPERAIEEVEVAPGGKDRETRESRERARIYRARQEFHASRARRRRRDDLIAGVVGGVIILAAFGSQVAYFTAGPGAPIPTQAPTPTTTGTPAPSASPPGGAITPAPPSPGVAP